jgi:hypothetical protein
MIYRVPLLDEPTKKFAEIPPINKGVITVFVFRVLAPGGKVKNRIRPILSRDTPLSHDTSSHQISIKNL